MCEKVEESHEPISLIRKKLSLEEQIKKLEEDGVQFSILSQNQAKRFLQNKTYFFKLKSYTKNYKKSSITGKYSQLEFAYLVELSMIDTQLRAAILELCLSLEHQLKVMLIREITDDSEEDGYTIIQTLLNKKEYIKKDLASIKHSSTYDLWSHYKDALPVWVFVELCSYHAFLDLFELYFSQRPERLPELKKIIQLIHCSKFLRNASAHNNCLLNSLLHPYTFKGREFNPSPMVKNEVAKMNLGFSSRSIKRHLSNPIVHDFVATLLLFKKVCTSNGLFNKKMSKLYDLFTNRFLIHKDYFIGYDAITGKYNFVLKVLDKIRKEN